MKRIILHLYYTSILLGALFFLIQPASGSGSLVIDDSLTLADTLSKSYLIHEKQLKDSTLRSQRPVTIRSDSSSMITHDSVVARISEKPVRERSPQRATILSAVLPGLGQAYNGKYWKIPIIYAAGYGLYYRYDYYDRLYGKAKSAYDEAVAGSEKDQLYNDKEEYRKKRDYSVIFMGILYLANIVDAMTDAYFLEYDMGDDLSLKLTELSLCKYRVFVRIHPEC